MCLPLQYHDLHTLNLIQYIIYTHYILQGHTTTISAGEEGEGLGAQFLQELGVGHGQGVVEEAGHHGPGQVAWEVEMVTSQKCPHFLQG